MDTIAKIDITRYLKRLLGLIRTIEKNGKSCKEVQNVKLLIENSYLEIHGKLP